MTLPTNKKIHIFVAAIGVAFGLGNIWRFPYVVAENGGGAFVLIYVFLTTIVGAPLLIGEMLLGKSTGKNLIGSLKSLGSKNKKIKLLFATTVITLCLLVLSYYSVISAWVMHFFTQFIFGLFSSDFEPRLIFSSLKSQGFLQLLLTSVHLIITCALVKYKKEELLEKCISFVLPFFTIVVVTMAVRALSLENAIEAVRFFLYPDFTKLTNKSFSAALGQMFFTLSIGFGAMITIGVNQSKEQSIPSAGFRLATLDSLFSIAAGLLIFPLVSSYFLYYDKVVGPELLFLTTPNLLNSLQFGNILGVVFFLFLYLAALGASVGLVHTITSNLAESKRLKNNKNYWIAGGVAWLFSLAPAFSSSFLKDVSFNGKPLIVIWDQVLIDWILPIIALILSQVILYFVDEHKLREELKGQSPMNAHVIYTHWRFLVRWVIPPVIVFSMILRLL